MRKLAPPFRSSSIVPSIWSTRVMTSEESEPAYTQADNRECGAARNVPRLVHGLRRGAEYPPFGTRLRTIVPECGAPVHPETYGIIGANFPGFSGGRQAGPARPVPREERFDKILGLCYNGNRTDVLFLNPLPAQGAPAPARYHRPVLHRPGQREYPARARKAPASPPDRSGRRGRFVCVDRRNHGAGRARGRGGRQAQIGRKEGRP